MLNQNFKIKVAIVIFVAGLLLISSYLLHSHSRQQNLIDKSSVSLKEATESSTGSIDKDELAKTAKSQFLQMKADADKIDSVDNALIASQKYFTSALQEKINQNLIDNSDEEAKLNLFWQTINGNVSLIEDITDVTAEAIDKTHVKLTITTKFTILEIVLVWENDAWRYDGEEKITHIIDETGKTYKIVTKEEAEYETVIDEKGQKNQRLKDGQAVINDEFEASAPAVINE